MSMKHVAFVMYPVTDIARAVAFYRDGLGLRQNGLDQPFWVEFDVGGTTFGVGNFEQVGRPGTAQALAIEVDDIHAVREALASRGVEASQPHDLANCLISTLKDPDGNTVWLHQAKHPAS